MSAYSYTIGGFDYWPSDEKLVESAWQNITYDADDIIERISMSINDEYVDINGNNLSSIFRGETMNHISLTPLDTLYSGRCYLLTYSKNMTFKDWIMLHFKSGEVLLSNNIYKSEKS